jgi:hypothetical protein
MYWTVVIRRLKIEKGLVMNCSYSELSFEERDMNELLL